MKTAPFQRGWDKAAYFIGTNFAIFFAYIIGKYPHTHIYPFTTFFHMILLCHRFYTYYRDSYHMYLWDWCYLGTFLIYFYINVMP